MDIARLGLLATAAVMLTGFLTLCKSPQAADAYFNTLVLPLIFFLPSIIALAKGYKNAAFTFAVNIFTGPLAAIVPIFSHRSTDKLATWPLRAIFVSAFFSILVGLDCANNYKADAFVSQASYLGHLCTVFLAVYNWRLHEVLRKRKVHLKSGKWESSLCILLFSGINAAGFVIAACGPFIQLWFSLPKWLGVSHLITPFVFALFGSIAAHFVWITIAAYSLLCAYAHFRLCDSLRSASSEGRSESNFLLNFLPGLGFTILPFWTAFCIGNGLSLLVVNALAYMIYTWLTVNSVKRLISLHGLNAAGNF